MELPSGEREWYIDTFLYPMLESLRTFKERDGMLRLMNNNGPCVTLPILGDLLQGAIVFQGFKMVRMELTLQLSKWFHQHHLHTPTGAHSTVNIKINRQNQSFNPLPLLQMLYVRNELEYILEIFKDLNRKNCLETAFKLKATIDRCLSTLNAYARPSEGKALRISSSITDPPLPPELSLRLYVHHGNTMLECIWSSENTRNVEKKGSITPVTLTIALPLWKDLNDLCNELLDINNLIDHLVHPCTNSIYH